VRAKMRAIARAAALVRKFREPIARARRWLAEESGSSGSSGRRSTCFPRHQTALDPIGLFNPGKIIDPPGWMREHCSVCTAFAPRPYELQPFQPALDCLVGMAKQSNHQEITVRYGWRFTSGFASH